MPGFKIGGYRVDGKVINISRELKGEVVGEKRHGHKGVGTRYIFI